MTYLLVPFFALHPDTSPRSMERKEEKGIWQRGKGARGAREAHGGPESMRNLMYSRE